MRAQEASWDSRMIVEKPVRNSAFCISWTMPRRVALMTSRSTASVSWRTFRNDDVLPFVHPRGLARVHHGGAVELIQDGGAAQRKPDVEALALIDRAGEAFAVEAHPPVLAQCIGQLGAGRGILAYRRRGHHPDATQPVKDDFDPLVRRPVGQHLFGH